METPLSKTLAKKRILLVEDDKFLADLLRKKLENEGADIMYTNSAEEIAHILNDITPDLFILDILLPGMDGFTALDKIRKEPRLRDVPAILLSNLESDETDQKLKKTANVTLLVKSDFNLDQLVEKIEKILKQ